ncbi:MAG: choice-of-anchor tandem repeat GloVer-containing protein [Candidatus Tumulicola sp.]
MKHLGRLAGACLITTLLIACGGGSNGFNAPTSIAPPPAASLWFARQPHTSGAEQVLHNFKGGKDGANPAPVLLDVKGALYGTTVNGGGSGCGGAGCGTVFKVGVSGKGYRVLYRFKGNTDGANPVGVIDVKGALYGTTSGGGGSGCGGGGCGSAFTVGVSGKGYRVLYSFKGGTDGASPDSIINVNGALYGATYGGDVPTDYGTVFVMNSSTGSESVLYNFKGGTDGAYPAYAPIDANGTLYGTTTGGDVSSDHGTVFAMSSSSGSESVLYNFKGGTDGATPYLVIDVDGVIYGATNNGGKSCNCGTVFRVNSSTGAERVLYSFKGGTDGAYPTSTIDVSGELYGATTTGGASGNGTVYGVNSKSGAESILYSFKGGTDGAYPGNGLTDVNGALYGTTVVGGGGTACKPISSFPSGCGTVFKLTP